MGLKGQTINYIHFVNNKLIQTLKTCCGRNMFFSGHDPKCGTYQKRQCHRSPVYLTGIWVTQKRRGGVI